MHVRIDKTQEHQSRSAANVFSPQQRDHPLLARFVDNRPQALVQRKRQLLADNHAQMKQAAWGQAHRSPQGNGAQHATTAGTGLVVQRSEKDDPDDFIDWIQSQAFYTKWQTNNAGDCAPSAKAIGENLREQGFNINYRGILLYHERPSGKSLNYNHFVVLVTIGATVVVLDPTQGQFKGGSTMVAKEADWLTRFQEVETNTLDGLRQLPSEHKDAASFQEANAFASQRYIKFGEDGDAQKPLASEQAAGHAGNRCCVIF